MHAGRLAEREVPFLSNSNLCLVSNDAQTWANVVNLTIPVKVCEPLRNNKAFHNRTAAIAIGSVTVLATEGSPVSVSTDEHPAAQLLMPYKGNGVWTCDDQAFENPAGASVLYVPPSPLRLENTITSGISLNFDPNQLIATAITMAGPEGLTTDLARTLQQPQKFLTNTPREAALIDCLFAIISSAESIVAADTGLLQLMRIDDLLMRLTLLLLFPELHQTRPEPREHANHHKSQDRLNALTDWIDAHLHQPLGLSDLEAQARYSRRSLQYQFKQLYGCTPMQWVRKRRLETAMERLRNPIPGDSIRSIAQCCGYANPSAFSRDFQTTFGTRPSDVLRFHKS